MEEQIILSNNISPEPKDQKKKIALIMASLFIISFSAVLFFLIRHQTKIKPVIISPLPSNFVQSDYNEGQYNISYYITTSQEFLNKARFLAGNPSAGGQTPEDKKKIIESINQALDLANQAIAAYPHDDLGFSQRSSIYQALTPLLAESANFAIQDLKEAIKLNNQNSQYYTRLANLYLGRQQPGDFENAALAFYNAQLLNPTDVQTIYNLADALVKSGQLPKANHYFEKLLSLLSPDDPQRQSIKNQQQQIIALLSQSKMEYLSEPGTEATSLKAPLEGQESEKIIGTQELPLEKAAISGKVIIASLEETPPNQTQTSAVSINAKSGEGIIPAGQKEITIGNHYVAADKQIVIVPVSETQNKVVFLAAKKASNSATGEIGWFKIAIDSPVNIDIRFNWWIID